MSRVFKWVVSLALIVIVVMLSFLLVNFQRIGNSTELGLQAVKYLYHFQNIDELDNNMDLLRKVTTDEVYNQLTIDNTDRALNVYLKFKNKPVVVKPIEATDKYIIYSLETDSITSSRTFVFFFDVVDGKVAKVREGEYLDFVAHDNNVD